MSNEAESTIKRGNLWTTVVTVTRASDWWSYKIPTFLGVACLTAYVCHVPAAQFWPRLLVVLLAAVATASFVSILNDITDEPDDLKAGKPNRMAGRGARFKALGLGSCLVAGLVAAWFLRSSPAALGLYLANWLAYTGYSAPPLRWKRRGTLGAIADACGGQLLPTLWTSVFMQHAGQVPAPALFLPSLVLWSGALGLRGILSHQLLDLAADRLAGVRTMAVRLGEPMIRGLVAWGLFPLEVLGLVTIFTLAGTGLAWALLAVSLAFAGVMAHWMKFRFVLVALVDRGRFLLFSYYVTLFPLTWILALSGRVQWAWFLAPLQFLAFPQTWQRFPQHLRGVLQGAGLSRGGDLPKARQARLAHTNTLWRGYRHLARARRRHPVCYDPSANCWYLLTYPDVTQALKNPQLFSNEYNTQFDPFLAGSNGEEHAYFQKALMPHFSRFKSEVVSEFTREWMGPFLETARQERGFDAVRQLSMPLPRAFTSAMLGLTPAELARFVAAGGPWRADINESLDRITKELSQVMENLRLQPRLGIISELIHAPVASRLTPEQILSLLRHLWYAGTVTLSGLIPVSIVYLARDPALHQRLRDDPSLVGAFISEVLRLEAPTQFLPRKLVQSADLAGVPLLEGAFIRLSLAAANRDPNVFPDPDKVVLERPVGRHLAFGHGEHFCLGAIIARSIATTAIREITAAFSRLRLQREGWGGLSYEPNRNFRIIKSVRIKLI